MIECADSRLRRRGHAAYGDRPGTREPRLAGPAAAIGQSEELWGLLGIPESMNPLLCASFGYAQAEEPAKEHSIAVTRI